MGAKTRSVFWDELEKELADPEFRQRFILERNRVETVDRVMNLIIDALDDSGLSRADVARAIGSHSSAVRRLLNMEAGPANPTLRTLSDVAAVLGFQVELVPMTPQTRHDITDQLNSGAMDSQAVAPTRRQRKPTTAA